MRVRDLLKVLSQLDGDDRVIFNLELLEEDGKNIDQFEDILINNVKFIRSYNEGILDENNLNETLEINLYYYKD